MDMREIEEIIARINITDQLKPKPSGDLREDYKAFNSGPDTNQLASILMKTPEGQADFINKTVRGMLKDTSISFGYEESGFKAQIFKLGAEFNVSIPKHILLSIDKKALASFMGAANACFLMFVARNGKVETFKNWSEVQGLYIDMYFDDTGLGCEVNGKRYGDGHLQWSAVERDVNMTHNVGMLALVIDTITAKFHGIVKNALDREWEKL